MLIIVVFITLLMGTRSNPEGDVFMGKTKPKALRTSSLSGLTEMLWGWRWWWWEGGIQGCAREALFR